MWDDITDSNGNVLLTKVYRLENLIEGINLAFKECGISEKLDGDGKNLNKTKDKKNYTPNKHQKKKIEEIYGKDFEIYENAGR